MVLCPAEAPHKTKYRSTSGLVTCGQRMVGKCLCLDPDQPQVTGCPQYSPLIGCHLSHCHVTPILISDWLSRCHVTSILTCDWCRDQGRGGRWAQWRAISATARWVVSCHGIRDVVITNYSCSQKKKRSYNSSASLVVRAVCCSTDPGQENGEVNPHIVYIHLCSI